MSHLPGLFALQLRRHIVEFKTAARVSPNQPKSGDGEEKDRAFLPLRPRGRPKLERSDDHVAPTDVVFRPNAESVCGLVRFPNCLGCDRLGAAIAQDGLTPPGQDPQRRVTTQATARLARLARLARRVVVTPSVSNPANEHTVLYRVRTFNRSR